MKASFSKFTQFLNKKYKYKVSYIIIVISFIIWMLFLDSNSWLVQRELNSEIKKLEQQKSKLKEAINEDQKVINQLENIDSLERFAREHYNHKKENETLFLIETIDNDSIK